MLLKKLVIKNFKGIKEISIDLSANKNGIDKDIKIGQFKMFNNNWPIPGTSVLIGRNGIGKTTIISAISLFVDVATGFISQVVLNNLIEEEIQKNSDKRVLEGQNPFQINIEYFNNERKKISDEILSSIHNKKGLQFSRYNLKYIEWFASYHKKNSYNLEKEIEVHLDFVNVNGQSFSSSLSISKEGEMVIKHQNVECEKQVLNFLKNSILPDRFYSIGKNEIFVPFPQTIRQVNYYNESVENINIVIGHLINFIKEKRTIKLLKLCDKEINSIKYVKRINGSINVTGIVLENGNIIEINDLSSGTKKFLTIFEAIVRIIKISQENYYGLIIIDEVETNLHKELVQSLFLFLRLSFIYKNIQSIVTTHNVHFLNDAISNKQIFSIEKNEDCHEVIKPSSFIKSHESLIKNYDRNLVSMYPDKELARNIMVDIFNDL